MNEGNTQPNTGQPRPPSPSRSLEEAASEVDREIKVRKRCYDRWVSEGKLSAVDARDRLDRLQAALGYLEELQNRIDLAAAYESSANT